ncbi:PPE family protein [Mycobacterium sp.]|uniref:PPE family protein n=1 Tax=Mycobacterium sp. TaxID=1785 RepID=UPI001282F480|nr:PPE family protein [Mycobacterium sp.]KAA8959845.1 MAG: PPE family protein [Mycobacterium sp.]
MTQSLTAGASAGAGPRHHTAIAASHTVGTLPDYGSLPPEVNSDRIRSGPGSAPMLAAARAWENLAEDLYLAAAACRSVIAALTGQAWLGPASAAMAATAATHVSWLTQTAAAAAEAAARARQAATAYETAVATTVPPPMIAANRAELALMGRGNPYGQHAHAIAAVEADYEQMWAQDAAAMYGYADRSAAASSLTPFLLPQHIAVPGTTELMAAVPQTLRGLARPAQSAVLPSATVGRAGCIGPLSVPPAWTPTRTRPVSRRQFVSKPLRHNATDLIPAWA